MGKLLKWAAGAALAVTMFGGAATAATQTFTSCVGTGYNISTKVSGASDCTISSEDQDFLNTNPITVNQPPGFFGYTDWSLLKKDESASGTGQSGTWSVGNMVDFALQQVMLVFKSGNDTTLVGYLLSGAATSGTWSSPFTDPPFDFNNNNTKNVSHVSYYVRDAATPIPLPATGLLLLGALGALGLAKRRKML